MVTKIIGLPLGIGKINAKNLIRRQPIRCLQIHRNQNPAYCYALSANAQP